MARRRSEVRSIVGSTPLQGLTSRMPPSSAPILLIVLAVGIAIPLYGQGRFLAIEALFVVILPVILSFAMKERLLRWLWAWAGAWSLAQIVSDYVHGIPLFSAFAIAGPTVALLVSGLYWIHDGLGASVSSVMLAVGIGWVVLELVVGQAMASDNPWKYGVSTPVATTVLALAYSKRASPRTIVLLLLVLGGISLAFDSRIQMGLFLLAATAMVLVGRQAVLRGKGSRRGLVTLLVLATAMVLAYPSLALTGALGERAYTQQVKYAANDSDFVLATRMELPQMAYLAARHPFLGIGSYGKIDAGEAYSALDSIDAGIAPLGINDKTYLLGSSATGNPGYNSHSAALSTALFAGILALPFWIFLIRIVIRAVRRFGPMSPSVPALMLYFSGLGVWDAFFSPLTTRSHISIAVTIFLAVVTIVEARSHAPMGDASPNPVNTPRAFRT